MQEKQLNKYITFLGLYIAQSIPMSFFSTVVPVIMRQEAYSLGSIGLLQLVKLPWILKFLWAPLIDRSASSTRQYKRWIIGSELFYAAVILSVSFFDLQTDFTTIVILIFVALIASATQDIATDTLAILTLRKDQRGIGNGMQSAGSFLGALVGGGVLLLVYNYFGWQALLVGLVCLVLIALLPLHWFRYEAVQQPHAVKIKWVDILLFFTQKGIYKQLIFLALCYSGLIGILAMLKPFLVDLGYGMVEIGFMSGIVGTATAACFALGAGFLVKRYGLRRCMTYFCLYTLLVPLYFYWMSDGHVGTIRIYAGICLLWSAYGLGTILVYTSSMNKVRPGREGTDFTIQTVLTHLSSLILAANSGFMAEQLGYKGFFAIEAFLAFASFLFVVCVLNREHPKKEDI